VRGVLAEAVGQRAHDRLGLHPTALRCDVGRHPLGVDLEPLDEVDPEAQRGSGHDARLGHVRPLGLPGRAVALMLVDDPL
jgi:hypothetical protein